MTNLERGLAPSETMVACPICCSRAGEACWSAAQTPFGHVRSEPHPDRVAKFDAGKDQVAS